MRRLIPAIILSLLAAGCASGETTGRAADDERRKTRIDGLEGWIGASDRELVLTWGAPDAIYELADGSRVLTWRRVFMGPAIDGRPAAAGTQPIRYECVTNIDIGPGGAIRNYAVQGNGCPREPE